MPHFTTLAQRSLADLTPDIAPLPEPPFYERWLLENPYPPMVILGLAAVVAFVVFVRRDRAKVGLACLGGAAAVSGLIWLIATLVETPRERLMARTDELVAAAARVDTAALDEILHDGVRFARVPRFPSVTDKAGLLRRAETEIGPYSIERHRVVDRQATIDGPNVGRTQVRVYVEPAQASPLYSWWRVDWRLEPGEDGVWRAVRIEPLWIQGIGDLSR